jgi:hypothetical protein
MPQRDYRQPQQFWHFSENTRREVINRGKKLNIKRQPFWLYFISHRC